ncbi:hypothetical protein [Amycolatopsis sp. cmx-4-61]|uniref:hypothetical protein n=1 Tax=Amycolatopsis sp. cmx-4-61 TaxID=2790937 RepID=UPI00397E6E20
MGRHYRDEEPVPHPQDRTPRAPAEGRSEASGAFRTPGRSSISDAFGIAGRGGAAARTPGQSSGSAFFTEGAAAPGFPPENGGAQPAGRRGETSGSYPAAGGRRGETSGSYPAAGRRGETSGSHPVAGGESVVTRAPRRGETSGAYPVTSNEITTTLSPHRGEAAGSYPVAGTTTRSRRKGGDNPAPDRIEAPGGRFTRAARRGEATGAHPAATPGAVPAESAGPRSRRKGRAASPETAAERTEVITRQDDDPAPGEATGAARTLEPGDASETARTEDRAEATGSARTLDRGDDTGTSRAVGRRGRTADRSDPAGPDRGRDDTTGPQRAGRSEGTGSHRIVAKSGVAKSDATGSHRIVGKKAPRRRIATWPIACAVLALLIGLGVVGWNWADNELNSRAEAQASSCDGGTANMRVVVTPSAQKPLTAAAQRWNQAATVVHGQCVHVVIEAKPSAQVLDALVGRANLDSIGGLPAAWLPESSYWVSELTTKKPEMIGSPAQSVANARSADYPFVGLAGPGIDDTALRAAQTFREYLEQPAQQADFAAAGIKSA